MLTSPHRKVITFLVPPRSHDRLTCILRGRSGRTQLGHRLEASKKRQKQKQKTSSTLSGKPKQDLRWQCKKYKSIFQTRQHESSIQFNPFVCPLNFAAHHLYIIYNNSVSIISGISIHLQRYFKVVQVMTIQNRINTSEFFVGVEKSQARLWVFVITPK